MRTQRSIRMGLGRASSGLSFVAWHSETKIGVIGRFHRQPTRAPVLAYQAADPRCCLAQWGWQAGSFQCHRKSRRAETTPWTKLCFSPRGCPWRQWQFLVSACRSRPGATRADLWPQSEAELNQASDPACTSMTSCCGPVGKLDFDRPAFTDHVQACGDKPVITGDHEASPTPSSLPSRSKWEMTTHRLFGFSRERFD